MAHAPDQARGRHDLSDAEAVWGGAAARSLLEVQDLWKAAARLPLVVRLARAAVRDPHAFWITAVAIRRHRALQKPLELFQYVRFLRRREIECCMEVGTCWGGTFSAHSAVTAPHGRLIAVDAFPRENAAVMTSRFRSLARATQNVTCVWQDSHSGAAAAEIATALNGESLDVLFLDGDRTLKGVSRDYEMYSPLVRPGGVIAFHDIARVSSGVPEFWRSLRGRYESVEFIDRAHPPHGLGIGVIVKG